MLEILQLPSQAPGALNALQGIATMLISWLTVIFLTGSSVAAIFSVYFEVDPQGKRTLKKISESVYEKATQGQDMHTGQLVSSWLLTAFSPIILVLVDMALVGFFYAFNWLGLAGRYGVPI